MFAEGLETPPLILDDPFAFWDADRIARCLPVLVHGAHATQCLLFTASGELARAAAADGATIVELGGAGRHGGAVSTPANVRANVCTSPGQRAETYAPSRTTHAGRESRSVSRAVPPVLRA